MARRGRTMMKQCGPEEVKLFEGIAWGSGPIRYRAMMFMKAVDGLW